MLALTQPALALTPTLALTLTPTLALTLTPGAHHGGSARGGGSGRGRSEGAAALAQAGRALAPAPARLTRCGCLVLSRDGMTVLRSSGGSLPRYSVIYT
jgi:hypothetical protein